MSAKSKTSNETTEEVEEEVNEDEEEEENREVEDGRVWWIGKKVSEMLRFALPSLTPSLTWPQHPDLDHHHIPLKKYLDEAQEGSLLLFWHPDADDEEQAEGGGGIDWDEQAIGAPFSSAAGTTTFSWKFDDADQDDDDEEHEPKLEVETYVQVTGDGPRLQVLEGGFSPEVIGQASVLVKKVVQGSVPLMTNTLEASVQMPNYLHMTFFHRQTHFVMHEMFDSLYLPLCEKLGKSDRTGYLASLSKTFSRISNLKEPDPPLDYDSEEDETKKRPSKVASSRDADAEEGGKGGNGDQKDGKEEEEEDAGRSLEVLFLKNVNRMKAKFSQEVKEPTLGDLRQSWTDNYLVLSASLAFVKAHPVINSNAELDSEMAAEAKGSVETLSGLHTGYSDCYRSLFYLEKFFRVVGEGRLEALAGHADGLLEVLEFIWRLGKKDGISGKVQIILESAVQSLVELVTQELRPVNLLPSNMREPVPLLNSQSRVKSALAIVEEWESVITRYGESINQSAKRQRDGRQDFDPCRVLGTIASVRSICDDLDEIMKVLLEAQTGFSGEWSALIRVRDPDQLKNITSQVLKVLTAYDFNIFSPRNYDRWVRQKDDFQLSVQKWEQAVINAIHESFKDRLTSELVTAVAGVLGKQPCRAVFRELLISRLPDLLSAFATEVKGIRADFQAQQKIERPGTQAPLSGRVRWMATYLTKRLAAWTTLKDLYSQYQGSSAGGELWAEVGAEVEEVQHEVEGARAKMVTGWSERVTQQIPKLLVTPVLSRNPDHKGPGGWQVQLPGELQWIVWESGQLLQTGIKPPELAVHLTLHYQTLQTAAMSLHLTLNDYHAVLAELSQVQRELLSAELSGAERVLAAGQRVVTWSPAALTHFSASCKDVIEHVRALANKLMSITHRLEDYLATIQRTNLLEVTPGGASPKQMPSLMELMEVCSNRRDEALEILEETYDKLVTTLGSAGLLLDSAEEGAPEQLAIHIRAAPDLKLRLGPFLEHWKHNVKEAIILMMVGSIRGFEEWLNGEAVLFGVEANLTMTGALTLSPAPNTLATTLADALGQTVRCAMSFRHWAELDDGTAALDPAPTADDDTLAATTFYSQISTDPRLHDSVDRVQTTFAKVIHKLDKDLQKWYAYEHVWKRDKVVTVTRFCSRGPSVKQYDDKLRFYTHLSTELAQATGQLTHGCVNLNVGGLVKQVVEHIDEWMKLLGKGLLQEARSRMQHVLHQITTINSALQKSPDDLTALTVVMKGVGQVSSEQAHLHTALLDVSQMFHTLQVYGIKVPKRDYEQLDDTSARLEVLHQTAATVQKAVEPVQQLFLSSTQNKIDEFSSTVRDFHRRFEDQGPGSVGENLERGVELLKEYSAEVEELLKIRRALEEEEEIFDLAATQYPGLDNAIHVMKQMKGVFAIYQKLRTIETTWRTMRWPTAKLDELKHQVEGIQRDLAECEGSQDTEVGRSLHQRLQDHANSLEVTAALRQPAVQPRHWQRLIASAGCKADWVGGRSMSGVSVWDVLELRLSRHPLLVATTVAMAIKENILNNHLTNITHCWQHARLTVVTTSSLWYVDGLDGLLQHLHHHNLALKTLRSTKYCRPFEDDASRLAKTLVRIEELLEAWKSTQSRVVLLLSPAVSSLLDTSVLKVKHRQLIERTERRPMILELSANGSYVQEVSSLRREADLLLCRLSQSLSKPRRQCSRLYLLTDQEMTRLLAEPSCKLLSEFSYKLFNNVVAMKWVDTYVTGVVSVEGEQLDLPTAVNIAQLEPNAQPDAGGVGVGAKVQRIIDGLNLAMRKAMKSSVDELGREIRLFRSILQEQPVAAVTVAWRVWWAAGVDVALQKRAKGNRETLRQVLENVNEDLLFLLEAMGRGAPIEGEGEVEEVDDQDYEGTAPLSSVRTSSRLSTRTARRPQPPALPPERGLSLLMACIHARDVVAALIRNNTSRTDAFSWICHLRYSWQNSHSSLLLHAAHCHIEYGYEYSGCGNRDYVLTPGTERCILALINAITAHTPPLLVGKSGCGRQSLLETAAHLAARFITSFTMSKLTSANTLKILLTGTVIGGWWTVFRDCTAATPTVLSALASTLLAIHQAHSHTTSTPVIQIAGEEVSLHPSAGIILIAEQFPSGDNDGKTNLNSIVNANKVFVNGWKLPHSMETLTRPIRVAPPPINTLIFAWLQASAIPRAQEVGDVVAEVLRQVMESYRTDVVSSLRVYMRLTQQVMSTLSALQSNSTPVEAAAAAFRKVMVPLVPKKSVLAVDSVLDLLKPEDDDGDSGAEVEKESDKLLKETILRQLSLRHIPSQMETINTLVNDLDDWGCVVVVGPPRSGKSSVISVATRFLLQRESEPRTSDGYPQSPSDAPRSSSLTEGRSNTPMESQTKGPGGGGGGVEVEFLQTDRELADRFVFALRPRSYSTSRFYGNSEGDGLFSSLLQHLAWKRCRSFVVLEGRESAECLLRMRDLPGTLVLESLKTLQPNGNVTFIIEVCSTEEVPEWVLGRSAIVQISPDTLTSSALLPSSDLVPMTPSTSSTGRLSRTSQTPRTASKPNTPIPEDPERLSPGKVREYILHRLLQPVLEMLKAGAVLHCISAVDVLEQVNFLSRSDVNERGQNGPGGNGSGEAKLRLNDQLGSFPLLVQAALQVSRAISSATQLPKLQEEIGGALKKLGSDGILSSADKEVVQSLSSCGGAAFDQSWDLVSSSWSPWLLVGEDEVDASVMPEVGYEVAPTRDARRLSWLIGKMSQIYRPLVIVGGPGSGKTTTALQALSSLTDWRKIRVDVTCTTTAGDLEDEILRQVTRKSFDTLIPSSPTIFLLDDLGRLPRNSQAFSFLQGIVLHKGLYVAKDNNKWMNLSNVYIVGVSSYYGDKWSYVEGVEKFSGWAIYNMDFNEDACTFYVSSALTPISSLQSQVVSTMVSMTEAVAQRLSINFSRRKEPFIPPNKQVLKWHVAAALRRVFHSQQAVSSSEMSGALILNIWLHSVTSEFLFNLHSQRRKDKAWHEIQCCVAEEGMDIVGAVPSSPPVPLWPPGMEDGQGASLLPKYVNAEEAAKQIAECLRAGGVTDTSRGHAGIGMGITVIVDALRSLVMPLGTHTAPFLLLVGPLTRDKDVTLFLAANYMGMTLKACGSASEVTSVLGAPAQESEVYESSSAVQKMESSDDIPALVLVPASLLSDKDVCRAVLNASRDSGSKKERIIVVSGCKEEIWALTFELRSVSGHGRVVCLPAQTLEQHYTFVKDRIAQVDVIKKESRRIQEEIADFVAQLHLSYCTEEEVSSKSRRKRMSSPDITRGMTSIPSRFNRMPPVASMSELIDVFGGLLSQGKDQAVSALSDLEKAVSRVADLENHVRGLRETHSGLETSISEAEVNIKDISEKLEEKEASIVDLENTVCELRGEVATVERSYEELRGEVAEYIEETKAPLVEITAELSQLDMQRIRKLLSRAPLSAIQVLFECSVFLLGATDMSMKAVKHATHDNTFCKKLAAVCVPGLNATQISTLNEKLEQIKMTNDHMARVSDIGGVLLTYMRTLIFYWHRHHEDIQPRQARVEALKDSSKQLQVEIATKERLIRGLKEDITSLNATTKEEEGKMISLKGRKMDVEEELERVLAVINELRPHAERWQEAIEKQKLLLEQVTGNALLKAACLVYLTDLTPIERQDLTEKWEKDLVGRGLLKQTSDKTDGLKLVSKPGDLQKDVQAFVDHYAARLKCLLLRDPHHVVEEYLSGGIWISTETDRWKEEVQDRLDNGEKRLIYLWAPHSRALDLVKWSEAYLGKECRGDIAKETRKAKIIVIMDGECSEFYCPLCSTHTILDVTLDYKGAVHQFLRAILKWHSPRLEEQVQASVRSVAKAQAGKGKAEENLIKTFINSKKVTDMTELESFTSLVRVLNEAMEKGIETERQLEGLTSQVSEKYLRASKYITRLYQVTHLVSPLNSGYSVPITLLLENLAHKVSKLSVCVGEDSSKETDMEQQLKELDEAMTASVIELLDTRLHLQHRVTVSTCFALAKLDMEKVREDYVTSFLTPLDKGRDVWWRPKKIKKEATLKEDEKCEGDGDDEGEEEGEAKADGEEEVVDDAKEEEGEGDEKEDAVKEEEEEEEEEKKKLRRKTLKKSKNRMKNLVLIGCPRNTKRVFERLTSLCSSLFPLPVVGEESVEDVRCQLLKWIRSEDDAPSPSSLFCVDDDLRKASQEVLLARHLRPDLLISAMKNLVGMALPPSTLPEENSGLLSRALTQHWRPKMTPRTGISDLIQIHVGGGTQPLHDLLTAAKKAGLPYYKLTFLSMATASQQELRRRVVMAARRKTWLVLLDCEVLPDSLWSIHAALKLLPSTLSAPTVICLLAKGLHTVEEINSSVVVQLEIPNTLSSNLATHLQFGYDHLQAHVGASGSNPGQTQAAILATAYIFSLLQTRRIYGENSWVSRPLLTQAIFKESLSAAHHLTEAFKGKVTWETLAALLAKVTYGSVVTAALDQHIIDRIFADHLNDKSYFLPVKQMKVHRQASVVETPTPDGTTEQPGLGGPTGDEADRVLSPVPTITTPVLLGTSGGPHQQPLEAQGNILLYSFPERKLVLDLKLPPQQAIERVCEVAEISEAQLVGLSEQYRHLQSHQELTNSLEVFTATPLVSVPKHAVMRMLKELQGRLHGPLGPRAAQVVKEEDLETLAWQREVEIWDEMQGKMSHQLLQIEEALSRGCARPAQALLALSDIVRECVLDPDNCVTSKGDLKGDVRQAAAKDNLVTLWIARTITKDVLFLSEEWKARHHHLLCWAESELAPAVVRLGMMEMPGWWLTRLRQAVCTKAHWLLQGSLVYAVPSKPGDDEDDEERPKQGAYVSGGNLVGGRWYKDKVYPDAPNEPNLPMTFAVTVSHAMKPTPVGCAWVPVLEKRRAEKPLFLALLPLHSSLSSKRSPLHVILH
ncbi:uncharacterized protein LOC135199712 [Macrobrachium nipponense]|uniref:uncharacterized protein LOC135199712 n=1 Tax=Macrobrachium nipponense TaxID=159736 RepID=UPI0030C7C8C3